MNTSLIKRKLPLIVTLIAIMFVAGGYAVYKNMLQSKIDNVTTQNLKLDLKNSGLVYHMMKHPSQSKIFQLEITFTGKTNDFMTVYLGAKPGLYTKEVRMKKGKIDLAVIEDWYAEDCYLKIDPATGLNGNLDLEFQFLGMENKEE